MRRRSVTLMSRGSSSSHAPLRSLPNLLILLLYPRLSKNFTVLLESGNFDFYALWFLLRPLWQMNFEHAVLIVSLNIALIDRRRHAEGPQKFASRTLAAMLG